MLRRINSLLFGAVILVNLYILVMPHVPGVLFWLNKKDSSKQTLMQQKVHTATKPADKPTPNNLTIPSIVFNEPIIESNKLLKEGIWRISKTSTPDKGSNTVIVGHRFTYTDPFGSFYNLDKVSVGDEIGLTWNAKKYIYIVSETKIVPPSETSVENPTAVNRLTLYTCTPLYIPKDRLVVVADLKETL